jgi:hypothetical protein
MSGTGKGQEISHGTKKVVQPNWFTSEKSDF